MRRREFAKLLAVTVSWPMMANAQKPMPVIGWLHSASPGPYAPFVAAFLRGLSETGQDASKDESSNRIPMGRGPL